ncbi:MAG: hypothetical protein J7K61_03510 [Thermoplasmata archaeon]|nr:hypothetical protein [Thermoplasmata archaeon]
MKIRNLEIRAIEARRYVKDLSRPVNIRIDHNSSITLFSVLNDNEADVEFEYTASFGAVGIIKFEGGFIYEGEDAKKIAENWQSKKNMPNEIASQIHTAILHYCVPEAVTIARELKLPPPIPLPQVKFEEEKKKGKFGPEVM